MLRLDAQVLLHHGRMAGFLFGLDHYASLN
jgi:hypothetical protein